MIEFVWSVILVILGVSLGFWISSYINISSKKEILKELKNLDDKEKEKYEDDKS